MVKKVSVSGFVGRVTEKYRCVQVNKVEKVCGECGRELGAVKPYGQVFIPSALGEVDQVIIFIKEKKEDDQ